MNCNFFVFGVFFTALIVCVNGNVECYHSKGFNNADSNDIGVQSYCIYAQLENGTDIQHCDYDAWQEHGLPEWPDSEMGECVKAPGYLKFMRCEDDWCNTECDIIEPTKTTEISTEQKSTPSVDEKSTTQETTLMVIPTKITQTLSTSSHNVNEAGETLITSSAFAGSTTTQTPKRKDASTPMNVTVSQTTATCSKDATSNSRKQDGANGGIQGLGNAGTSKRSQMQNNPSYRPNNCNCRCENKKEQNTFIVINSAASYNIVAAFAIILVYHF